MHELHVIKTAQLVLLAVGGLEVWFKIELQPAQGERMHAGPNLWCSTHKYITVTFSVHVCATRTDDRRRACELFRKQGSGCSACTAK